MGEGALEPAIKLVRQHVDLTLKDTPVETDRTFSTVAPNSLPDDHRVWLGLANLAIRTGPSKRPTHWLDLCRRARPEDVPVWRADLHWGMAANRIDAVQQALRICRSMSRPPADLYWPNAWLAANAVMSQETPRTGTFGRSRPVSRRPASTGLASWLKRSGQAAQRPSSAAKRPRSIGGARYLKLHDRKQPIRDAVELARLAEQLGRRFEARVFLSIAISEDPDCADLRRELDRLRPIAGRESSERLPF